MEQTWVVCIQGEEMLNAVWSSDCRRITNGMWTLSYISSWVVINTSKVFTISSYTTLCLNLLLFVVVCPHNVFPSRFAKNHDCIDTHSLQRQGKTHDDGLDTTITQAYTENNSSRGVLTHVKCCHWSVLWSGFLWKRRTMVARSAIWPTRDDSHSGAQGRSWEMLFFFQRWVN